MEYVNCLICGSKKSVFFLSGRDRIHGGADLFTLVRCNDCGFVYQNPRPTLSEIKSYYPEDYYSYQPRVPTMSKSPTVLARLKAYVRASVIARHYKYPENLTLKALKIAFSLSHPLLEGFLAKLFWRQIAKKRFGYKAMLPYRPEGRLLEVGCGSGTTLEWYREHGWEVAGVELSQAAAERANKIGIKIFCGPVHEAGFPKEYFDSVILFDTIEHLHKVKETLCEIRRVLKKDGTLFLTTQNILSLEFRLFKHHWPALDLPRHLYDFDRQSLNKLLTECGFRIYQSEYTVAPGAIEDCLRYLKNDLTEREKHFASRFVNILLRHRTWLMLFWKPFAMFLFYVGLSGGLRVVATPEKEGGLSRNSEFFVHKGDEAWKE